VRHNPLLPHTAAAELHNKPVQLLHALLLPARLHPSASLCKLTQLPDRSISSFIFWFPEMLRFLCRDSGDDGVRRGWKPWKGVVGTIRSWKIAPAAPHRGAPGLLPRGTWNKAAPRNGRGSPAGALWWERAVRPPHPRCSHPRCRGRRYRGLRRGAARPDAGCRSAPCSRESAH